MMPPPLAALIIILVGIPAVMPISRCADGPER
jgi:hypothetical protein